jgi:hypothetical protein
MARDWEGHACDEPALIAPPAAAMPPNEPVAAAHARRSTDASQHLVRIRRCIETVALLLAADPAYLPIFLRLERELKAAQADQDALERSRYYLPGPH